MLLIVVVGMSLVFAFFVNYVRDFQLGRGSSVLELAIIEDVWFRPKVIPNGPGPVRFWIYNYGKIDIEISSMYVDGVPVIIPKTQVEIGQHVQIDVLLPWDYNEKFDIMMVTERGSVFEGEYSAPSEVE